MDYTTNFSLKKPIRGVDMAKVDDLNDNTDDIDELIHENRTMIAESYDQFQQEPYKVGDIREHDGHLYKCIAPTSGVWDSSCWDEVPLGDLVGDSMPPITAEAEGNPIELTDAASAPMVRCVSEITGSQDLHGYDKPWVGGSGKNKLDLPSSVSINANSTWMNKKAINLPAGNYCFSCVSSSNTGQFTLQVFDAENNEIYNSASQGNPSWGNPVRAFTLSTDGAYISSYSNTDTTITEAQIESGFIQTSYEPYSNICPISGFSEVNIYVCGKNVALLSNGTQMQYSAQSVSFTDDGGVFTANGTYSRSLYKLELEPLVLGKKYTISFKGKSTGDYNNIYFGSENELRSADYGYKNLTSTETEYQITFTAVSKDLYITFYVTSSATSGVMTISEFQIELGEVKTEFEPYKTPNSYTISIGSTRYGGTLDVKSGVLRVTHVKEVYDGSNDEAWQMSSTFIGSAYIPNSEMAFRKFRSRFTTNQAKFLEQGETYTFGTCRNDGNEQSNSLSIWLINTNSLSDFQTYLSSNNLEILYELATPIEVSLTPTVIRSLLGNNYISCNTGDMEIEYYTKDWQKIIDLIEESEGGGTADYSETEHVVGKWIDGSTVYEKTFKIDNPTSTVNPSTLVNLTNNEIVIDIQGYLEASDGTRLYNNFGDSTDYQLKLWYEVGAIKYRANCGPSSLTEITFSIQYIKTSS